MSHIALIFVPSRPDDCLYQLLLLPPCQCTLNTHTNTPGAAETNTSISNAPERYEKHERDNNRALLSTKANIYIYLYSDFKIAVNRRHQTMGTRTCRVLVFAENGAPIEVRKSTAFGVFKIVGVPQMARTCTALLID